MAKDKNGTWLIIPLALSIWAVGISARFIVSFLLNENLNQTYETSLANIYIDWTPMFLLGFTTWALIILKFIRYILKRVVASPKARR